MSLYDLVWDENAMCLCRRYKGPVRTRTGGFNQKSTNFLILRLPIHGTRAISEHTFYRNTRIDNYILVHNISVVIWSDFWSQNLVANFWNKNLVRNFWLYDYRICSVKELKNDDQAAGINKTCAIFFGWPFSWRPVCCKELFYSVPFQFFYKAELTIPNRS